MTDGDNAYASLVEEAFGDGDRRERLTAFVMAMRERACQAAIDNVNCRDLVDFGTVKGQISICTELLFWANLALSKLEAQAGADGEGGSPTVDPDVL